MTPTKPEALALLVLRLAKTNPVLMAEARELAIQVLGDYVVQEFVTTVTCHRCDKARAEGIYEDDAWCGPCFADHTRDVTP